MLVMFSFCEADAFERRPDIRSKTERLKQISNLNLFNKPILRKFSSKSLDRTKRQTFSQGSFEPVNFHSPLEDLAKSLNAKLVHRVNQGNHNFPSKSRKIVEFTRPKIVLDDPRPPSESTSFVNGEHDHDTDSILLQSATFNARPTAGQFDDFRPSSTSPSLNSGRISSNSIPLQSESFNTRSQIVQSDDFESDSFKTSANPDLNSQDPITITSSENSLLRKALRPVSSNIEGDVRNAQTDIFSTEDLPSSDLPESHMIRGFKGNDGTIFFIDLADLRASGLQFDDTSDLSITGVKVSEVTNFDDQVDSLSEVEDTLKEFSETEIFRPGAFEETKEFFPNSDKVNSNRKTVRNEFFGSGNDVPQSSSTRIKLLPVETQSNSNFERDFEDVQRLNFIDQQVIQGDHLQLLKEPAANGQQELNIHGTAQSTKISSFSPQFSSTPPPPPVPTFRPSSFITETVDFRKPVNEPKTNPLRHLNSEFQSGKPTSGKDNSLETLEAIKSSKKRIRFLNTNN